MTICFNLIRVDRASKYKIKLSCIIKNKISLTKIIKK